VADAKAHFQALIDHVPALGKLANAAIILQITGEVSDSFVVYLPKGEILDTLPNLPVDQLPQRLTLTLSAFWMRALVDKLISWEDFVLSFRIKIKAEPDVFNEPVVAFLQLESSAEREAFVQLYSKYKQATTSRVKRVYQGQMIEYDRYCPHNGEDLSQAPIENGEIICLRHFWRFATSDGKGTNNQCSLNVKVLGPVE
jgi:UDP-MurNAc hydroxylase